MRTPFPFIVVGLLLSACSSFYSPGATAIPTSGILPTTAVPENRMPTIPPSATPTILPSATPTLAPSFITNGGRSEPYVALTFDLCQIPEYPAGFDKGIVNVLEQYDVPATFFLGGDWMRTHQNETLLL